VHEELTDPNVAQIITAIATLITALAVLVGSVTVLLPLVRRTKRIETHVDGQRTAMAAYQATLIRALKAQGMDVPEDQSAGGE
jgi:uncharacterized protein YabE (DUF348 family)